LRGIGVGRAGWSEGRGRKGVLLARGVGDGSERGAAESVVDGHGCGEGGAAEGVVYEIRVSVTDVEVVADGHNILLGLLSEFIDFIYSGYLGEIWFWNFGFKSVLFV
jgi:hypothetical protein